MAENKTTNNPVNDNSNSDTGNNAKVDEKEKVDAAKNPEVKEVVPEPEPTLREDYELLKNMNLLRNIMIRAQYGKYPNAKIDALLKRRMDIDESKFQGPRIVRAIISILALFIVCTIVYIIILLASKGMNLQGVADNASLVISLFFFTGLGFVIFNNLSVPDEKKLKVLIKERMTELEIELNLENKPESKVKNVESSKQEK